MIWVTFWSICAPCLSRSWTTTRLLSRTACRESKYQNPNMKESFSKIKIQIWEKAFQISKSKYERKQISKSKHERKLNKYQNPNMRKSFSNIKIQMWKKVNIKIQTKRKKTRESLSNIEIQIFFFSRTACREIRYQNPNMFCLSVNIGRNWGWWNWRTSSRSEVAELDHLSWNQDPGAKWAKGCTGIFVTVQKDHPGPVHYYYYYCTCGFE